MCSWQMLRTSPVKVFGAFSCRLPLADWRRWLGGSGGSVDCHAVLGVPKGASRAEIKAAFLAAAKRHHPDISTTADNGDAFVRLRSCYEMLLRQQKASGSIHKSPLHAEDPPVQQPQPPPPPPPPKPHKPRISRHGSWAALRAAGSSSDSTGAVASMPLAVEVSLALSSATMVSSAAATIDEGEEPAFCGTYRRTCDFNFSPAYARHGGGYFLFWSAEFRDWKIGERLADDGLCAAYAEGDRRALQSPRLRWAVWDAGRNRFAPQQLSIRFLP